MNCPFCNLKKERTRTIAEGEYSSVIFSDPRLMPGHLLIVPRRHVEKFSKLKKKEMAEMMGFMVKFQEKILKNIASGCDIRQNNRPFQKESNLKVHHFHIHLQPREFKDELYEKCQRYETAIFQKLPKKEAQKLIKILRD